MTISIIFGGLPKPVSTSSIKFPLVFIFPFSYSTLIGQSPYTVGDWPEPVHGRWLARACTRSVIGWRWGPSTASGHPDDILGHWLAVARPLRIYKALFLPRLQTRYNKGYNNQKSSYYSENILDLYFLVIKALPITTQNPAHRKGFFCFNLQFFLWAYVLVISINYVIVKRSSKIFENSFLTNGI